MQEIIKSGKRHFEIQNVLDVRFIVKAILTCEHNEIQTWSVAGMRRHVVPVVASRRPILNSLLPLHYATGWLADSLAIGANLIILGTALTG
jgi:hypothetical protein